MPRSRSLPRNRLVDRPLERRRVHGVVDLAADPLEQRDEAPAVERLDRALALPQAEPVEGRVREVEAVHRQVHGDGAGSTGMPIGVTGRSRVVEAFVQRVHERPSERRLARTRAARDPE